MVATKIGGKRLSMVIPDGQTSFIVLSGVKLVPSLWVNLFSLTQSLSNGWNIRNQGIKFVLTKDNNRIVFDKVIKTHKGHENGIELVPVTTVANVTVYQDG
jgi:hypothetical protein